VEQLADEIQRAVLRPLLDAARRLGPNRRLVPRVVEHAAGDQALTWTWDEAPSASAPSERKAATDGKGCRPPAEVAVAALESLFCFGQEHWAGGVTEVFAMLGRRLWPVLSRSLVQHFNTCGVDDGEAVERFELAMFAKGFIGGKEKTLSRHVHEHRHALGEQRRAAVLAEARKWILEEDSVLVAVSDAEEPGSVTQLLQETGDFDASRSNKEEDWSPETSKSALGEQLRRALKDDEALLRLPKMRVSTAASRLAGRLRSLMEETVEAAEHGREEAARDLTKVVRELTTLFLVLRPYAQKVQLRNSPRCGAVFLADCLYLAHILVLMPYTYGKRLPGELRRLALFIDLVPQLRRLGENSFMAMLRHQQDQVVTALSPCDFSVGIANDSRFVAAEAALGAAVQRVKLGAQGLATALPKQLLKEVTGLLLGVLCQDLLGKLFALQRAEPEEVGCISALLHSALNLGRQVFEVAGIEDSDVDGHASRGMLLDVPRWATMTIAAELLGSDFSRYLEKRVALLEATTREEAVKLMQLSWRNEAIEPDDAWEVLRGDA